MSISSLRLKGFEMSNDMMTRIARGTRQDSDAAFSELVAEYQGQMTGFAFRILRDWQESENVVQSVLLTVWQRASDYRDQSFTGWLYTLLKRRCIDQIRKRHGDPLANRVEATDEFDPLATVRVESVDPADAMSDRESLDEIRMALETIPDDQRATFELFIDGASYPEIADACNEPLATIKSRSRLCRRKVRERISL